MANMDIMNGFAGLASGLMQGMEAGRQNRRQELMDSMAGEKAKRDHQLKLQQFGLEKQKIEFTRQYQEDMLDQQIEATNYQKERTKAASNYQLEMKRLQMEGDTNRMTLAKQEHEKRMALLNLQEQSARNTVTEKENTFIDKQFQHQLKSREFSFDTELANTKTQEERIKGQFKAEGITGTLDTPDDAVKALESLGLDGTDKLSLTKRFKLNESIKEWRGIHERKQDLIASKQTLGFFKVNPPSMDTKRDPDAFERIFSEQYPKFREGVKTAFGTTARQNTPIGSDMVTMLDRIKSMTDPEAIRKAVGKLDARSQEELGALKAELDRAQELDNKKRGIGDSARRRASRHK